MTSTPVSVVVDRDVLPGKLKEFKSYVEHITEASSKYAGYMGTDVINPEENSHRYIIIFRFDSKEHLAQWTSSEDRKFWVNKIDQIIEQPTKLITITGLETWFCLSRPNNFIPPPKYKMALVTYFAIAPTLTLFDVLFGKYFASLPGYILFFVTSPIIVILMTYIVMPVMSRLFKRFLYPKMI